jgi:hypothetical protein
MLAASGDLPIVEIEFGLVRVLNEVHPYSAHSIAAFQTAATYAPFCR